MSAQGSPGRTRRKISENVRELYATLSQLLNDQDRSFLIQSLNQYQKERDVKKLVVTLKSVLDTPGKKEVYPLLLQIIPPNDKELFHTLWHHGIEARQRSKSSARSPRNLHRIATSSSLPEKLNKYASDSGIDLPNSPQFRSLPDKHPLKRVTIKRPSNAGFGFCIRGGSEHGVGLYVSSVDENSLADTKGLLPGDHILLVNDTKFDGLTHAQAVKIIQNSKKLNLIVRSVGRVPNTYVAETTCKWVDTRGRRASPPPGVDSNGRILTADGIHKSDLRLLGDDDERKVSLFVEDGSKLGLMIRGGADYGLGIYIAGVDPQCVAEQAGLKAGDQILDVNGQSFLNVTHKQAVKVLKSTKNMILTLKDIGRLPFTRVTHDKTRWIERPTNGQIQSRSVHEQVTHIAEIEVHAPPGSARPGGPPLSSRRYTTSDRMSHERSTETSMFHHGIAGSQVLYNGGLPSQKNLITEQARLVLNENELGTMKYYLDEYLKGYINISALVLALFDLFNTRAKMSLLTEIRGSVAPKDIDRFDDLVLKKEIEIMKNRQFLGNHMSEDRYSLQSNASSVSSFSGLGSNSSKSSAKGSLDGTGSRPITPPQVPEVLPPNVKVTNDDDKTDKAEFDVYEATLTFDDEEEQTLMEAGFEGLPSTLTISSTSFDDPQAESTPVPPLQDGATPQPLLASSPKEGNNGKASPTKTNGEATPSTHVGDNSRSDRGGKDAHPSNGAFKEKSEPDKSMSPLLSTSAHSNGDVYTSTGKNFPPSTPPADSLKFPQSYHGNESFVEDNKQKSTKPQSPPSPFIFPSKYVNTSSKLGGKPSEGESSHLSRNGTPEIELPTKDTANSSRGKMASKPEVELKYFVIEERKQDIVSTAPEDDPRPEVSNLAGNKRVASWGTDLNANEDIPRKGTNNGFPVVSQKPERYTVTTRENAQVDGLNDGLKNLAGNPERHTPQKSSSNGLPSVSPKPDRYTVTTRENSQLDGLNDGLKNLTDSSERHTPQKSSSNGLLIVSPKPDRYTVTTREKSQVDNHGVKNLKESPERHTAEKSSSNGLPVVSPKPDRYLLTTRENSQVDNHGLKNLKDSPERHTPQKSASNGLPFVSPKPDRYLLTTRENSQVDNHGLKNLKESLGRHDVDNRAHSTEPESSKGSSAVVLNMVHKYNHLSDNSSESSSPSESRRGSVSKNRLSWDGVRNPGEPEEKQTVSRFERRKNSKTRSSSDSNLMNLPKEQQKTIQTKHRASQQLYELHQQSKAKDIKDTSKERNVNHQTRQIILETRNGTKETIPLTDTFQPSRKLKSPDVIRASEFVVEIDKSSGSPLGLTIQGGSDTGDDITVKSVKEGKFAAWNCGKLQSGQILLQVNDTVLSGMTSGMAVLALRQAYANADSNVLKLLVRSV